ncbi:amino acid permease, partial [Nocardia wallacei]|uniref:amino acid permease n=1 Tax=Nocardia wallacei TaxID=480035 RepID=UPI002456A916
PVDRLGRRGGGRVLQRPLVGAAGRALPGLGRDRRVRARTAGRVGGVVPAAVWVWWGGGGGRGAAVAALGALLALILGVSRTTLAMARDRHLPHPLAAVHPRFGVPHRAELAVGVIVAAVAAVADVRAAIGFSSFAVLLYYAVANASAYTLTPAEGRPPRAIPILGLIGCLALAFTLPLTSVTTGAAVLAAGAAVYGIRQRGAHRPDNHTSDVGKE